jgi:hypothetical protein
MRMILFLSLIIVIISTINGQFGNVQQVRTSSMFQDNLPIVNNNQLGFQSPLLIPFPQCLTTDIASQIFNPSVLQNLFDTKLQNEERKLRHERLRNDDLNNSMMKIIDRLI